MLYVLVSFYNPGCMYLLRLLSFIILFTVFLLDFNRLLWKTLIYIPDSMTMIGQRRLLVVCFVGLTLATDIEPSWG